MKRWIAAVPLLITLPVVTVPARADAFDSVGLLSQDDFQTLTGNVGAATHYKSISPGETLGVLGFDVAVELSSTDIDDAVLDRASNGDADMDSLLVPRLHAHKGLPFGLDIGASVGQVAETDMTVLGAELRYSIIDGNVALPAVGVRASYSLTEGSDNLDVQNAAVELSVSKGFLMLTPYGGVGYVRTTAEPGDAQAITQLEDESVEEGKLFIGLNVNLGFNFGFEMDRTGDYTTYSAKAGIRF